VAEEKRGSAGGDRELPIASSFFSLFLGNYLQLNR